ncbi:hypothetical protein T440DRAFT_157503 [Plenodomus tracheiphilus IPT5]|uniref:Uncharacterized protein n=1 Tax=Plenodomus tracheiphilus IPT5 TaxID=1408161 RepID=A0A6A7BJC3_9PLEO|nr:hypothetical protein T440DRAFT_157503 [Plenodomus tracheiphilus IPT5]
MPYLVQPPLTSNEANNPLYTYAIPTPDAATTTIINDLRAWGWRISWHATDDENYLTALHATSKATKKRRRRTQMIYGDIIGDAAPPTLSEVWEREAEKIGNGKLYTVKHREEGREGEGEKGGLANDLSEPGYKSEMVSTHTPNNNDVDEWYNAEISRLKGITECINERWKGLPLLPTTATTTVEAGSEGKRMSRVWAAVERLDRRSVDETLLVGRIPFSMRPIGLF